MQVLKLSETIAKILIEKKKNRKLFTQVTKTYLYVDVNHHIKASKDSCLHHDSNFIFIMNDVRFLIVNFSLSLTGKLSLIT